MFVPKMRPYQKKYTRVVWKPSHSLFISYDQGEKFC